jgi:hypothetical protein
MKKLIIVGLLFVSFFSHSQTAVNFTCNDCGGTQYDLFNQLDAGKVVVLVWVMPCGTCVLPAKTAYNVAHSYESTYPGKVVYYLCDDYGTTSCTSIANWANTNSIVPTAIFSNSSIDMLDYGETGMPKMLVIGGPDHKVYDNQNNTFNHIQISEAIDLAISESVSSIDSNSFTDNLNVLQSNSGLVLNYNLEKSSSILVSITDYLGRYIIANQQFNLANGANNLEIYSGRLTQGFYLVTVIDGNKRKTFKVAVN